jgi:hypothetical protein
MRQLYKLDLLNNPIQTAPGYRVKAFEMFPSLMVLDTLDNSGKDANTNTSMIDTVSRIPDNLFDKSPVMPAPPLFTGLFGASSGIIPSTSLFSSSRPSLPATAKNTGSTRPLVARTSRVSKGGKTVKPSGSHTRSSRAGLVFPVTRIKRHLHGHMINGRVSVSSAIYAASVL